MVQNTKFGQYIFFISHVYKYNPKNMISGFLPKYYIFFVCTKVYKNTNLFYYIYNPILRRAPDSTMQNIRGSAFYCNDPKVIDMHDFAFKTTPNPPFPYFGPCNPLVIFFAQAASK